MQHTLVNPQRHNVAAQMTGKTENSYMHNSWVHYLHRKRSTEEEAVDLIYKENSSYYHYVLMLLFLFAICCTLHA